MELHIARQQCYNDVHGWYQARIEQLFAHLWHWGVVRNIWLGGADELHQFVRILLHFTQFCIRRQMRYPPYGPWEHIPTHVWADDTDSVDVDDETLDVTPDVCALCCHKRKSTPCIECKEHYCEECLDSHTCGAHTVYV
mmetsp:Transcript_69848/g.123156  ORF Transcript_69848/g.123156 Transcript_69848/m.123156 type:complete len:139 (-) Transcript_69848:285-701(-)